MVSQHQQQVQPCSSGGNNDTQSVLRVRKASYGPNTALSYATPLHIVRGEGCYLTDANGDRYLDCVNNVAHVGHCHPQVTEAVCRQLASLNTNSRYLHADLTTYTTELLATLPPSLKTLYLCNSGSEANDLALRIARTASPGATHIAVMGGAYHGHLQSLIEMSPYKFWGTGGQGRPAHVHVLPCPDPYRGEHLDGRRAAQAAVAAAHGAGGRICAFYCESIMSCGGQVVPPPGYLKAVYELMRAEGAVCIADEVQCGFGRVGDGFWAFEPQGVVPDMLTIGKSIGNGYPVAGLVVTGELAQAFSVGGMEYFNTYGGGTAACTAALATLRVVKGERLQQHAAKVGAHLKALLQQLQGSFPVLGDVRGQGLMLGIEVVRCPHSKEPAPRLAVWIKERAKARRALLSTDGPYDNVLKIKPPLAFGMAEAEHLVSTLRSILQDELTPSVAAALNIEEERHAKGVIAPRRALYDRDWREMEGCFLRAQSAARTGVATSGAAVAAGSFGSAQRGSERNGALSYAQQQQAGMSATAALEGGRKLGVVSRL